MAPKCPGVPSYGTCGVLLPSEGNISFGRDQFDGLKMLRFLKLDRADIQGNFTDYLSSLRWLDWQVCTMKPVNLNLQDLLILDLSWSQVNNDWRGWKLLSTVRAFTASKLKVLKLIGCVQLSSTPIFPDSLRLERLILEGCSNLAVINLSFHNSEGLVSLNVKGCSLLSKLPNLDFMRSLKELLIDGTSVAQINFQKGSMTKLKTLSARDCRYLTDISDSIGYLKSLKFLTLDGSRIQTLPGSVRLLEQLKALSMKNCWRLYDLPDGIGKLRSLRLLDLSYISIQELSPSVENLKDMKVIRMRDTAIREFPEAILNLEKLEEIDFSGCRSLEGTIPDDIWRLSSLVSLKLSDTGISGLPPSISSLSRLQELDVSRCDNLQSLPELPSSLINVHRDLE